MGWVNKLQAPEGLVLEELKLEILWCVHCTSSHILVLGGDHRYAQGGTRADPGDGESDWHVGSLPLTGGGQTSPYRLCMAIKDGLN